MRFLTAELPHHVSDNVVFIGRSHSKSMTSIGNSRLSSRSKIEALDCAYDFHCAVSTGSNEKDSNTCTINSVHPKCAMSKSISLRNVPFGI